MTGTKMAEPARGMGSRGKKKPGSLNSPVGKAKPNADQESKGWGGVLLADLSRAGITHGIYAEFHFHPKRKWAADFAYPSRGILIEIEGGSWSGGRHTRGQGYANDCEKYNAAQCLGYIVLRFTSEMIRDNLAVPVIANALEFRRRFPWPGPSNVEMAAELPQKFDGYSIGYTKE